MRGHGFRNIIILVLFTFCVTVSQGCQNENAKILVVLPTTLDVSYSAMEEAAQEWAQRENIQVTFAAPSLPTAQQQQKVLEEQLQNGQWDAICIRPLGTEELSPLLEYAADQGTVIVTMFGEDMDSADYNILPFSLKEMGAQMMIALGDEMEESGIFMTMVPSMGNQTMLDMEMAAINEQKSRYADLMAIPRLYETGGQSASAMEGIAQAYEAYRVEGVLFFSANEGLGVAQWQQDADTDIATVGLGDATSLADEVESGLLDVVFYWDESNLLLASLDIASAAIGNAHEAGDRISLSYEGYENMRHLEGNTWHANDIRSIA